MLLREGDILLMGDKEGVEKGEEILFEMIRVLDHRGGIK